MKYLYQFSFNDGHIVKHCDLDFSADSDEEARKISTMLDTMAATINEIEESDVDVKRLALFKGEKIG